jgi:hypothetical protein
MRVRSERILGIILLGVFLYFSLKLRPFLKHVFETANQDCGYDKPVKSIMLAILCLTLLAAIKLILTRK